MKTKKINLLLLVMAIAGFFISCDSNDDSQTIIEEPAEVGILSFGFYVDDNSQLLKDYVIENITETTIQFSLPSQVDFTTLVARFTTTENDKVTVGGSAQISGETANDFSAAVEYILNEEETNQIYTINVSKMANAVWSTLGVYEAGVREISLAVNPTNGIPHIGYISDADDSANRKLNVVSYNQEAWTKIGGTDFSPFRARSVDLNFKKDGTPVVSFGDTGDDLPETYIVSLMEYTNNSWSYVGERAFASEKSNTTKVVTDKDGNIFDFYINGDRQLKLKIFDGGTWNESPISGTNSAVIAMDAVVIGEAVYVSALNFGDLQSVSVFKYEGGNWTTIADKMKENAENVIRHNWISMDVDTEGNVYVAYSETDAAAGTDFQLKVKKYTAETQSWSILGDIIPDGSYRTFSVAVDGYNNPMLLYRNETNNPVSLSFDQETNNWASPVVIDNNEVDDLWLEFAPNGIGYAVYTVDNQLYLQKYDSPDNN